MAPQPLGDQGELQGPIDYKSQTASIHGTGRTLVRYENECQEDFERRVGGYLPAIGLPGIALLFPDDLPPAGRAMRIKTLAVRLNSRQARERRTGRQYL
ncbi:MAG TPA: hypothetical protein VK709_12255 [Candidatus Saccharimonadales bacterium]|nr:hypothetical protein [Candidatus Saccharimonadales bacterium]